MFTGVSIQESVQHYITRQLKLPITASFIVGLSGGADSVALLHILHALGYRCIAAHCNFNLRGEESKRDALYAKKLALQMEIPFCTTSFDTYAYCAQNKCSIEMGARALRYDWFEQIRTRHQYDYIAVAHHRDDAIETLLLNLVRGTGIAGLCGIQGLNGVVARPLLCISRKDVEEYLSEYNLSYMNDSTNFEAIYVRNKIRLQVLPLLESINPSAAESMARTARNITEAHLIYKDAIERQKQEVVSYESNKVVINIPALTKQPAPRTLLFEILHPLDFGVSVIEEIAEAIGTSSGKQFFSSTHRLVRDRISFVVVPLESEVICNDFRFEWSNIPTNLPIKMTATLLFNTPDFVFQKSSQFAYFDAQSFPREVILRRWRDGDRFVPFGMQGSQKLSNYFSDHKFSLLQKEATWVLEGDGKILWIVGYRAANQFTIQQKTSQIIQFNCDLC